MDEDDKGREWLDLGKIYTVGSRLVRFHRVSVYNGDLEFAPVERGFMSMKMAL